MHLQVCSSTASFFFLPSDCPSEMRALLVILSVIGAVLAVALALLLIWRVLATIQVSMTSPFPLGHREHLIISHGSAALNAFTAFKKIKLNCKHNGEVRWFLICSQLKSVLHGSSLLKSWEWKAWGLRLLLGMDLGIQDYRLFHECKLTFGDAFIARWTIFTISFYLQDRRAFAKFEKEQQNAKCVMVCLKNFVVYFIIFTLQHMRG